MSDNPKYGAGYYSDNTKGCYDVIKAASTLVLSSLDSMGVDKSKPLVIADYGTADGGTSMPLMWDICEHVRSKCGDEPAIQVNYEDQPINDFKSLFMRLHGLIPGTKNFLQAFPNVFVTSNGTSFYQQCYPAGSVDLAFSATAMHWLTQKPCNLSDALHHTISNDVEAKAAYAKQAAADWECILLQRAKEMRAGARAVIVNFAVDENGYYLGNTDVKQSMWANMDRIWKAMGEEGRITPEEVTGASFINYYRTPEEFRAPFDDESSPVRKAGLKLVTLETKIVRCPYRERWLSEGGDAKAHAKRFIPTTRTWSNSTYLSALGDHRSAEEKEAIVDEFFGRYEAEVAADPDNHAMDFVHGYIVLEKEA